jgi:hypothetical protein
MIMVYASYLAGAGRARPFLFRPANNYAARPSSASVRYSACARGRCIWTGEPGRRCREDRRGLRARPLRGSCAHWPVPVSGQPERWLGACVKPGCRGASCRDACPERKACPAWLRGSHAPGMAAEHYDPFVPGPSAVGVRTLEIQDRDRGRVFPCEIWYPAANPRPSSSPAGGRGEERDAPAGRASTRSPSSRTSAEVGGALPPT